ncbi:TonB-dependent receptor [Pseudoalteromonas sp. NEC-BIFX-2020_002]|uniref:TonB-dependent receptor domain-containing protein n=1 Tax=Pseudoalteromonas sp. NEC-BIFX-2020_002 TaxID=2732353 RepID=UPI00147785FB|nr:TonB-dependent receptor [Pseudoalteromonas sp. NEC-BIFX-2020_002]NNG42864.1 TonB-dependent receptor [Pseudoalteromonas sp. NEC-BIFX-2020_002]
MLNNKISKAVRLAIAFGAASTAVFSASSIAEEKKDGVEKVERIEITGSRLRRTDLEGVAPITTISGESLGDMGISNVGEFVQSNPVMSGSPATTNTNNGGNGGVFVELRGLGSSRTLVLINGRKPVSSDFQNIPSAMIERIEILKDGASVTYGSSAMAGVVNVITKKEFTGVEIKASTSWYDMFSAGKQENFEIVAGKEFDGGHITVGFDYTKQDPIYQGDVKEVDFFQYPWQVGSGAQAKSFYENGLITPLDDPDNANVIVLGSGSVPCGNFYLASKPGTSFTNGGCPTGGDGKPALGDMREFVGGGANNDTYNYAPVNLMQTPYEVVNFFVDTSFEIFDDVTLYTETRINKRESKQELAAVPYDTRFDPAYLVKDPGGNLVNGVSKDNFYNPFGEDVLRSRRRMLEGGRSFEQDYVRFQNVIGVRGDINDSWTYDVYYNYGANSLNDTDFGQLYGPNLANAMGPSFKNADGDIVCGTEENPIPGCVSLNVFGGPGTVTQEMLDYVTAPLGDSYNDSFHQIRGDVAGELFELPAGYVGAAFGLEYYQTEFEQVSDSGKFFDAVTGNTGKPLTGLGRHYTAATAEFLIPLLSDTVVETLDLTVGGRYDDFSTTGTSFTWNAKLESRIVDGFKVRANYSEVYREPTLSNLYSPAADSFESASDPCGSTNWNDLSAAGKSLCVSQGVQDGGHSGTDSQIRTRVGGNTAIQAESGETITIGFVWAPHFVDNLGITVDYWDISIDDKISSLDTTDILNGCFTGLIDSQCAKITRAFDGTIDQVDSRTTNLAGMTAKGIDVDINYGFDLPVGSIGLNFAWTHFLERGEENFNAETATFILEDLAGRFENDTSYFEDKILVNVNYTLDNLRVVYSANYLSSLEYSDLTYFNAAGELEGYKAQVESKVYHDLSGQYTFDTNTSIQFGIRNISNELPPYIETASNGNTDESNYRLYGRQFFAGISQKF